MTVVEEEVLLSGADFAELGLMGGGGAARTTVTNFPLEVVSGTLCTPSLELHSSGMLINHGHAEEQGSGTGPCGDGVFDFGEPLFKDEG